MDTGDSDTTVRMYSMPLICTLQNGSSGNIFVMCILPQFKVTLKHRWATLNSITQKIWNSIKCSSLKAAEEVGLVSFFSSGMSSILCIFMTQPDLHLTGAGKWVPAACDPEAEGPEAEGGRASGTSCLLGPHACWKCGLSVSSQAGVLETQSWRKVMTFPEHGMSAQARREADLVTYTSFAPLCKSRSV